MLYNFRYDKYWRSYWNWYYNYRSGYYDCLEDEIFSTDVGVSYNITRLDEFLKNVENNQPDAVRAINYGIEGDPMIFHLFYDGENILAIQDTTNATSGFTKKIIRQYNGDTIEISKRGVFKFYNLMKDGIVQQKVFSHNTENTNLMDHPLSGRVALNNFP